MPIPMNSPCLSFIQRYSTIEVKQGYRRPKIAKCSGSRFRSFSILKENKFPEIFLSLKMRSELNVRFDFL